MAKYKSIVTTDAGLELLENAAYVAGSVQFTTLKTGNGTYDGTETLASMTDIKSVCQTFGIGSVSKKDGSVVVRIAIDNTNLTEGYKMTELGLYATEPDTGEDVLYAIIVAEEGFEDYLPPYADAPTSITFEAFFELTESMEAVTFTVAAMEGVYVPVASFNEHLQDDDVHVTAAEKNSWTNKAEEGHKHSTSDISDFPSTMTPSAHTHTKSQITDFPTSMTPTAHTHTKSEISDFPSTMTPEAHTHTKSQITDFPTSMTPSAHSQAASTITAGTLAGQVKANESAMATVTTAQVRDIVIVDTDPGEGTASSLPDGTIVFSKE